jgi:flagellar motor component MotA
MNAKLKFAIGLALGLALFIGTIYACGGRLVTYVDVPSIALVLGLPLAIAFASWPVKELGRAFGAPFDAGAGKAELERSILFLRSFRRWVYVAAGLGTMIGIVAILVYYNDGTDKLKLSRNVAVALLCVMQALFFDLFPLMYLESLAKRRLAEPSRG